MRSFGCGIIIGDAEGSRLVADNKVDQEVLSENRANLEARLVGLGLVRRLALLLVVFSLVAVGASFFASARMAVRR